MLLPLLMASVAAAGPGEPPGTATGPDRPASTEPASTEPASTALDAADAALLDALLALLSDEGAVEGAHALGMLADPRALWVLRHSVTVREPAVAAAAARALGAFPAAAPDLQRWVTDDSLADAVRVAAAEALATSRPTGAADAIIAALGMRSTSTALHDQLRAVLARTWPERLAEADRLVRRDGTAMLMIGSGAGMGYALAATGHFGRAGLEGLGGATGALGGATLGFVYGRTRPVEAGRASYLTTTGIGGLVAGTTVGAWAAAGGDDGPWVGGVLGGAAGYGLGLGLWSRYPGSSNQAWLGGGVGLTSAVFTSAAMATAIENHAPLPSEAVTGSFGVGMAAGLVAGHLTAPRFEIEGRDASLIIASGLTGAFVGGAMPLGDLDRGSVPVATTTGGMLLAYALSPQARVDHDVVWGAMTGLTYGAVIGGGVGMLIDPPAPSDEVGAPGTGSVDDARSIGAEQAPERTAITIGGGLGLLAGGYLARRAPGGLRFDDATLVGLTTGWATWQTVGWERVTDPDPAWTGALVLTPAVIGAGTAAATPLIDVDFGDSLAASSLGLWGAYLGAAGGTLVDADSDTTLMLALGLSDVGLLSGAALMSPLVDASPTVVGVADAGGVLGGSTAALATALFTDDSDAIILASLGGAGVGAAGGALLGRRLDGRSPSLALHHVRLPAVPSGLHLAPTRFDPEDCDCWGATATLDGW